MEGPDNGAITATGTRVGGGGLLFGKRCHAALWIGGFVDVMIGLSYPIYNLIGYSYKKQTKQQTTGIDNVAKISDHIF